MSAARLFIVVVSASCSALAARITVSADYGWRFFRGLPLPSQCETPFGQNYTGQECTGLSSSPSAASVEACEIACCADPSCEIWQWSNAPLPGGGCWTGQVPAAGCQPGSSWTSFANTSRADGVPSWASLNFSDADWQIVDAPHDFIISGANETESPYVDDRSLQGQAFIPKTVGVYRKHFALPANFSATHVELYVEGMYAYATYYLNGFPLGVHALGYTSFFIRLDNANSLFFDGMENVLAVLVDATSARDTGWWYEGGGVMRHTFLSSSASAAHVVPHGLWADISISQGYTYRAAPADGVTASGVVALAFAEIETDGDAPTSVVATFTLTAPNGTIVAVATSSVSVPAGATATAKAALAPPDGVECWSVARPALHTLSVSIALATAPSVELDSVNASVGVRGVRWDADLGSFVNEQRVRLRAFCDHESFAGVGMAIADRLQLFRFQAQRGMGGNGRRFSHNPPAPALLDMTDRLGVLTLDENRVFAIGLDSNMADLVQRDRNHPSVIFWSFCNEPGCNNPDGTAPTEPTQSFKFQVEQYDGTRAVTGNMCVGWGSCPKLDSYISDSGLNMSLQLDIQGFSHVDTATFSAYHDRWPAKPLVGSECCSCETQRGEADDIPYNKSLVFYSEFNADCQAAQTQWALGLPYVAGSFVWTLTDYFGEPDAWPHVSSSFGSYDLAGFPKAAVYWFRSWWLANVSDVSPDRPPIPATAAVCHIVETWKANSVAPTKNRTIHVYTNAAYVSLALNGAAVSATAPVTQFGYATFSVAYAPGTLAATAYAADGTTVLATANRSSWGAPAAVRLSVDVPSALTGTGSALYLDGEDTALLRATIVDTDGNVCEDATNSVSFAIASGPGVVVGSGNGDPANHEPNHASSRAAYHGLVRALVRVTQTSAVATPYGDGGNAAVALLAAVNVDAGRGPRSSKIIMPGAPPVPIGITASADGLAGDAISIPTSVDFQDSPLQVASNSVRQAYVGTV